MHERILKLKKTIEDVVFITAEKEKIFSATGKEKHWLFDFRRILLKPDVLDDLGELFWEKCKDQYPFQIGAMEVAGIPILTAFILKLKEKGKHANGYFIRKSRKKTGLLKMVEGEITNDKIILVDDIINRGFTMMKQVEVAEAAGKKVAAIFTVLRFRETGYYTYFKEKNIPIISLFALDDFKDSLHTSNLVSRKEKAIPLIFDIQWYFKSENPNYAFVVPKSAPALDKERVFFGSDNGNFWAINQHDGSVAWSYKVLWGSISNKCIFSSPVVDKDTVYFGAYDGNVYALDTQTGKKRWIFMEADWVGSSPSVAPDLGLLFIGEEFGLWNKHGGIVALDLKTGHKKWAYREMPELTHSSPLYIKEHGLVVIGSNDGVVYCFDAKKGDLRWKFKTDGGESGAIKASFTYDKKRNYIIFGSYDAGLYILEAKTGLLVNRFATIYGIYSTPLVVGDTAVFTSLDKYVYCINLDTFELVWKFVTYGRIFASPEYIEGNVYIGSNDGRLYEIDAVTGKNKGFFQAIERITNKIAYNAVSKIFFLPTFANEIYCLARKE